MVVRTCTLVDDGQAWEYQNVLWVYGTKVRVTARIYVGLEVCIE